ncbi:hypothetical protein C3B44_05590 [Corynebacterium yudongzhengii]|uniref:Prolipoprotein LppL n=1 Tax=Corynebacterium yudongzhengii TaxID=2080740 RepID=A0A2U1T8F4_9CORY|nr:hypothetical protein C3B44_05590 [Corynebacterium yudongzhengii]PWC02284.1 hypothetical protein DF222_02810 [Corynebacterium yudongzhengii]
MRRFCAVLALTAVTLTACGQNPAEEDLPDMGNATPADSPAATAPDGEVIELGEVTDLVAAGGRYGVRVGDELFVGTLDELREGVSGEDISGCTDVTANAEDIVVACGSDVRIIGGETVSLDEPAESAVLTSTGELVVASGTEAQAAVYANGERIDDFSVAGPTDELAITDNDKVVRINRADTTIQDLRIDEGRQGGTLRVGLGVGTLATGDGDIVVVSDTLGNQIAIYTVDDVIRLHQTAPVDASPWAVAHDGELAWIASTAENTATGYDVSSGVPMEESSVSTIANVTSMVATADGLVLGGSDGLQIINES